MKKLLSNKAYIAVFVAPGLILFLVMAVIPLFTTGYYGLFNYDGIGEKVFIGLKNYKELFTTDPYFLRSVLNSFILAAGSLFIQILSRYSWPSSWQTGSRERLLQNCIFPAGSNLQYGNRTALVQDLQQ